VKKYYDNNVDERVGDTVLSIDLSESMIAANCIQIQGDRGPSFRSHTLVCVFRRTDEDIRCKKDSFFSLCVLLLLADALGIEE